jgi:Spy/CpxP family protein refolding chaperone
MNKPWQVCLVLVAIFAAGGISGGLVAFQIARKYAPPPPGVWIARRIENVARELQLTPAQMERVQPIVKRNVEELTKLSRQSMQTVHGMLERMETEIGAELTPEQRTKYEQILKERREVRRRMQERHGMHGDRERHLDDRPPPLPPPPKPGEQPVGT